jgi:hypothetical protein
MTDFPTGLRNSYSMIGKNTLQTVFGANDRTTGDTSNTNRSILSHMCTLSNFQSDSFYCEQPARATFWYGYGH